MLVSSWAYKATRPLLVTPAAPVEGRAPVAAGRAPVAVPVAQRVKSRLGNTGAATMRSTMEVLRHTAAADGEGRGQGKS